jgi:hypothetical protein
VALVVQVLLRPELLAELMAEVVLAWLGSLLLPAVLVQ